MAPWIKYEEAELGAADYPFHSGTAVDLLHGDLTWAATENAFDICVGPPADPGAATYYESATLYNGIDAWTHYWPNELPVQIRPASNGSTRSITISLYAALSGSGSATVRAYVRASSSSFAPGAELCYAQNTVNSTTYAWYDFKVTLPEIGEPRSCVEYPADALGSLPPPVSESRIMIVAQCDTASRTLRVQGFRLQEGAP